MFVLDTNTLVYFFMGMGHVTEHFLRTQPKEVAIPSLVLYELEVGVGKSGCEKRRDQQHS